MQANLEALRLLRVLEHEQRPATREEQEVLAAWSGWGAVPQLFDEQRDEWGQARAQLRELAGEHGYEAARRTTINAHYTDPRIAAAIWQAVAARGFIGGRVLEPGCGAGIFLALAPAEAQLVGVELDPTTAAIDRALYPTGRGWSEHWPATPATSMPARLGSRPARSPRSRASWPTARRARTARSTGWPTTSSASTS